MRRVNVSSGTPWEAEVGYCRLVKVGKQIYVSGTTAALPSGEVVAAGDAYAQTLHVFQKIESALREVGAELSDIVRTRMFVVDMQANYPAVARAHKQLFGKTLPAATMVEVSAFVDPAMLIEIEADGIEGLSQAALASRPRIVEASFEPDSDLAKMLLSVDLPMPAETDNVRMLKAYVDGELVGCVGYERHGQSAVLHSLVVNPEAKGEGVGRALVETLLARLRDAGCGQVFLMTADTTRYFGYFGFAPVALDAVDPEVRKSPELSAYAPGEATCMRYVLGRR
jgi:enamine deaminase RidA (YjgF/YER057c/UK114 family)/N-acetylglutamate synthase-like GNAT family acetyltransferase